jgi:hypothetical protein
MSLFDIITSLANEGRELTFKKTDRLLTVRLDDPRRDWHSQFEMNWRDVLNGPDPDRVLRTWLEGLYRDHFRTHRNSVR